METNTAKSIVKYNNANRKIILGPRTFNFKNKKVALCLGSGGMRGSYQAGVIKALEEKGIKADIVVGTSIGSLNGAAYVQGYTADELINLWTNIKQEDIYTCEWTTNEKLNQVLQTMMNQEGSGDLLLIGASLLSGSVDNYKLIYNNKTKKISVELYNAYCLVYEITNNINKRVIKHNDTIVLDAGKIYVINFIKKDCSERSNFLLIDTINNNIYNNIKIEMEES
jgi:hypothetical protein